MPILSHAISLTSITPINFAFSPRLKFWCIRRGVHANSVGVLKVRTIALY